MLAISHPLIMIPAGTSQLTALYVNSSHESPAFSSFQALGLACFWLMSKPLEEQDYAAYQNYYLILTSYFLKKIIEGTVKKVKIFVEGAVFYYGSKTIKSNKT